MSVEDARKRAQELILAAAEPAVAKLMDLMRSEGVPFHVQLAAARDILDRAGLGSKQEVELSLKPWEQAIASGGIVIDIDADDDVVEGEVVEVSDALGPEDSEPSTTRGQRYRNPEADPRQALGRRNRP